ncbi:streptomycin 6-kinase [Comamonas odontotermitis]|uniref:Streptomycin 6-kinase n=1 Tax=Comamonas odontotermitis TaxID=379895 RepID=A0ABR6RK46_9BURK|nr:aminoglycoside phosphotransferase family protein [Comamonas odontotermitis]MBB6579543.1 streptomycin 6-kinase [Comamonas odontotermitis]
MPIELSTYLKAWSLVPDGPVVETHAATLLPVIHLGRPAMLKVSESEEETAGYDALQWWGGSGAVQVYARSDHALLMERAAGARSLAAMSQHGKDGEATRTICTVVAQLHAARATPLPALTPLPQRFASLVAFRAEPASVLRASQRAMEQLLAAPRDVVCLHGDVHHHNILDGGKRGWLAIDPKGLLGERGFDYANLFCNPDAAIACHPQRFEARLQLVAQAAHLDRQRLLQWILAWSGLSAVWHMEDETPADIALQVAGMAAAALNG